ncbi:MAG: hypothetical protein ACI39G_03835 [Pseudoramibacter sp.]
MSAMSHMLLLYRGAAASGPWWQAALLNTLLVPVLIVVLGLAVRLITRVLLTVLGLFIGGEAAYLFGNYLTYPGVVHHELAHALLAWLLGARIQRITLRPQGQALGSVDFVPRGGRIRQALQMTLSSIAPVVLGLVTLTLIKHFLFAAGTAQWVHILGIYLAVCIFFHMDLSGQDVRVALAGLPVCLLILFCVFAFWRVDLLNALQMLFLHTWA